jgi:hypothetical protein
MAIANLRPKLLEVETTLQHCADELVGHLCEAWPELEASVKCIDVALFVLERADQRDAGAAVKAATIIFAELTLAVTIVFIVLLLVRVYG